MGFGSDLKYALCSVRGRSVKHVIEFHCANANVLSSSTSLFLGHSRATLVSSHLHPVWLPSSDLRHATRVDNGNLYGSARGLGASV